MSLFVKPDQEIKVVINVASDDKGRTVAWNDWIAVPKELQPKLKDIKKYEIYFRHPTYRDTTEITEKSLSLNDDGDMALHTNSIRFKRLCRLIKRWTLTDEDGKAVEPNMDAVSNLDPVVANVITYGLEVGLGLVPDPEEGQLPQEPQR